MNEELILNFMISRERAYAKSTERLRAALSPAGGVAASVADSSTVHGVCSVSPPTSAVLLSVSMISSSSDRSDKENVCVRCVGMSTVNESSSKAAVTTPIVESSLELQKTMSPGAGTALNVLCGPCSCTRVLRR